MATVSRHPTEGTGWLAFAYQTAPSPHNNTKDPVREEGPPTHEDSPDSTDYCLHWCWTGRSDEEDHSSPFAVYSEVVGGQADVTGVQ